MEDKSMDFIVKVHKSRYGYDISCPVLPGCASQGETEKEAMANIKDAIRDYLIVMNKIRKGEYLRKIKVAI
jgi:predicted RNase H-like HicB family nuclease